MEKENLDQLINKGIRLGAFIEYIPLTPGLPSGANQRQPLTYCTGFPEQNDKNNNWSVENDHELILTPEERWQFREWILHYRETNPIYLIHSPGDEDFFGGCVSAGRGFAHVTPNGDLTPCPASNIATHNLTTSSLREALASNLFKEIRDHEHLLEVEGTPCALFSHPKEVNDLARAVGAYRTGLETD
jgi:MoaA/NifB/PqqE/SkfB family radical SAM enzyme